MPPPDLARKSTAVVAFPDAAVRGRLLENEEPELRVPLDFDEVYGNRLEAPAVRGRWRCLEGSIRICCNKRVSLD